MGSHALIQQFRTSLLNLAQEKQRLNSRHILPPYPFFRFLILYASILYDPVIAKKSLSLILKENQFSTILTLGLLCHVEVFSQTYV